MTAPAPLRLSITPLWLAIFLCLLLALTWFLDWSRATEKLDNLLHDSWVRMTQRKPPDNVVIAAIDPASLRMIGRWPWDRTSQALLFRQLAGYKVKAAVIDMLFIEPASNPDHDSLLTDAIAELPIVVLPILTESRVGEDAQEKLPLPKLTRQANDLGHIHLPIDNDGIVRRVYLKGGFNQPHWSTLALAAYGQVVAAGEAMADAELPGIHVPPSGLQNRWEQDLEVFIPFYGPRGTIPNVSAASIINGQAPQAFLENKIVFVGLTSTGLSDVVPTPVSALDQPIPGVEIHANIFSALMDNTLVTRIDSRMNLLLALFILPVMLLVYSRARPQWGVLIALVGSLVPVVISYCLYRFAQYWYAPWSVSLTILFSYIVWSWNRLSFLSRFVESEIAMLSPLSKESQGDNERLARFFRIAAAHLPIRGWRFTASGQRYAEGETVPVVLDQFAFNRWYENERSYHRRYPTPGKLEIHLLIDDPAVATEITDYIDSLSQIRSRVKPSALSGPMERLQINTSKFSDQVAWLRNVNEVFESLLEGNPAGVIVWHASGAMARANSLVFDCMPALSRKPALAEFIAHISDAEGTDLDERIRQMVIEQQGWQLTHVDGESEYVVTFSVLGDTLLQRLVCATLLDVSQIRTAERARAEMVDYLNHDLRSPLISALALLDTPRGETPDSNTRHSIENNINISLRMMDDLLHVARADSLTTDSFTELLFNSVVDNAIDQMMPQARTRNVTLEFNVGDDELWMLGDTTSLQRAVVNIIGNAIKYSNEGGVVQVQAIRVNDMAEFRVTDQGVGIDPAIMGDLFTRFKRDQRVAAQFKGIGLGLALVARVVGQHGGQVRADSPGKGTIITMSLPLLDDAGFS